MYRSGALGGAGEPAEYRRSSQRRCSSGGGAGRLEPIPDRRVLAGAPPGSAHWLWLLRPSAATRSLGSVGTDQASHEVRQLGCSAVARAQYWLDKTDLSVSSIRLTLGGALAGLWAVPCDQQVSDSPRRGRSCQHTAATHSAMRLHRTASLPVCHRPHVPSLPATSPRGSLGTESSPARWPISR